MEARGMGLTTTTSIGSIPITGGTDHQPWEPTHPTTPDPSDEECELELQLERTREKKRAEEEAKRKAEEEKQKQEAAVRVAHARKMEEEGAEKRRKLAAAARNHRGPSPGEATTSTRRVEVEVPRVVKKGKSFQRNEASGRDPDDGNDDDDNEEEQAPCERCFSKKISCLEQVRREGGLSGERMAVMESQMAQLLADNRALREATQGHINT
ncbi:hypothetical protein EV359DRAFT_87877 [Lentinula novae-zelandiae]|nr:hypothetical protein EV359DRAFT_87877 [Lentinula novae-zelandiae]